MKSLVARILSFLRPYESPYRILPGYRLTIEDERFRIGGTYFCNYGSAVWSIGIEKVEHKVPMDEAAFRTALLELLAERPIGYGKVIVSQKDKIIGNVLLPKWGIRPS